MLRSSSTFDEYASSSLVPDMPLQVEKKPEDSRKAAATTNFELPQDAFAHLVDLSMQIASDLFKTVLDPLYSQIDLVFDHQHLFVQVVFFSQFRFLKML